MDLVRGQKLAALMVQEAEVQGAEEERLALLRQWISDANALLMRAQQEMSDAAAAAAPPPPIAGPEMLPPGAPPLPGGLPMGPDMGMPPDMPPM